MLLPGSDFDHQMTLWVALRVCFEASLAGQPPGIGGDYPIGIQSVRASIKGAAWIMVADLDTERRDIAARHIGRVGDDKIERAGKRASIIAQDKCRARIEMQRARIGAR